MLNVRKLFTKILGHVIFEQGTDGIWTYRKYADGTAECWGSVDTSTSFTLWTAPIYYGSTYSENQTYPTNLFIEKPNLMVSMEGNSDCWIGSSAGSVSATKTGRYYPVRVGSDSTRTFTVKFHAIGKWK